MSFERQAQSSHYLANSAETVANHLIFWKSSDAPEADDRIAALLRARERIDDNDEDGFDREITAYSLAVLRETT